MSYRRDDETFSPISYAIEFDQSYGSGCGITFLGIAIGDGFDLESMAERFKPGKINNFYAQYQEYL